MATVTVRYDDEWNEFQAHLKGAPKATYHTDDYRDAIGTARVMAGADGRVVDATPKRVRGA